MAAAVEEGADSKITLNAIKKEMKEYAPVDGREKYDLFFALAAQKFQLPKDGEEKLVVHFKALHGDMMHFFRTLED